MAEIKLTCGEGTDTPAQLQLVTRIPWKYGASVKETSSSWILVRVQAFVSKALFARPAQVIKLGRCALGFAEPSSGKDASCQLVGWDVVTPDERRSMSPLTMPSQFDLDFNRGVNFPHPYSPMNMDSVYCLPQLSATNFEYTRLPHVSHGVFCSGPTAGTYALPPQPSDSVADQLRRQHLAQSLLYGGAPSAVVHVPPPPGRGRSMARSASRVRVAPAAHKAVPPAPGAFLPPGRVGAVVPEYHLFFLYSYSGILSSHPDGAAAHALLAANRATRIRAERLARPAPTLLEQQAARVERARQRELGRDLDDFMSAASVGTADPMNIRHF